MLEFIFLLFFYFFIILETPMAPLPSPVPQNTPKFWGVSTHPQCAFPRSHAPVSQELGGTLCFSAISIVGKIGNVPKNRDFSKNRTLEKIGKGQEKLGKIGK